MDYPDALSAAAPAGAKGMPIILVNGTATTIDAATKAELSKLGTTTTYVVGGTGALSHDIQNSLPNPNRLAGADRFATNLAVAKKFYPTHADNIYVATGYNFPDALVGGVLAGMNPGPLMLTSRTAWPTASATYAKTLGFSNGYLFGGTGALSDNLQTLKSTF